MARRLRNIVLKEVSLVDEPANRRKFFVVKSDEPDLAPRAVLAYGLISGTDVPETFEKGVAALDADAQAGVVALLETAGAYGDVMPDKLAATVCKLAEAAVAQETLEVEKATADKVKALRDKGNVLIKDMEKLLDEARKNDGNIRLFAQSLAQLEEFTSSVGWLIETALTEREGEQPERRGLGTKAPLGKAEVEKMQDDARGLFEALSEAVSLFEKGEEVTEGAEKVSEATTTEETQTAPDAGTEAQPVVGTETEAAQPAAPVVPPPAAAVAPAAPPPPAQPTGPQPGAAGTVTLLLADLDAKIEAAKEEGARLAAEAAKEGVAEALGVKN